VRALGYIVHTVKLGYAALVDEEGHETGPDGNLSQRLVVPPATVQHNLVSAVGEHCRNMQQVMGSGCGKQQNPSIPHMLSAKVARQGTAVHRCHQVLNLQSKTVRALAPELLLNVLSPHSPLLNVFVGLDGQVACTSSVP
jgi:hypothetical protein